MCTNFIFFFIIHCIFTQLMHVFLSRQTGKLYGKLSLIDLAGICYLHDLEFHVTCVTVLQVMNVVQILLTLIAIQEWKEQK